MANPEHLLLFNAGPDVWNHWRTHNPEITPALNDEDFSNRDLKEYNLHGVNMIRTNLSGSDLEYVDLSNSALCCANLTGAILRMANLKSCNLGKADISRADMRSAELDNANVTEVTSSRTGLYRAINLGNCYGSQIFRRKAMDQDFIEEFRVGKWHWRFWLLYLPWLILCDCGRSFLLWLSWCIAAATVFACAYEHIGSNAFHLANGLKWNFDTLLYYSTVTITTLGFGDVTPTTPEAKHWVMAEVILGYILLGGLISIMATKLTRRSG